MGMFGGKKAKKEEAEAAAAEERRASRRKSRRVIAPGAKPGAPSKGSNRTTGSAVVSKKSSRAMSQSPAAVSPPPVAAAPEPPAASALATAESSPSLDFTGSLESAHVSTASIDEPGDGELVDFLVNKVSLMTQEQVDETKAKADADEVPFDSAAYELGYLTEEQLVNALTQECWVPHLKVDKYEIRKKALDTITIEDARRFSVLPVDKLGSILNIAMVNPLDNEAIRQLEQKTGLDIKKVVATRSEIEQGIARYYGGEAEAKEGSLEIAQDHQSRRVTRMLSRAAKQTEDIVTGQSDEFDQPMLDIGGEDQTTDSIIDLGTANQFEEEIADIDDLLSGGDEVAPEIVEPLTIDASEIEEELDEDDLEDFEPELVEDESQLAPVESELAHGMPGLNQSLPSNADRVTTERQDDLIDLDLGDDDLHSDTSAPTQDDHILASAPTLDLDMEPAPDSIPTMPTITEPFLDLDMEPAPDSIPTMPTITEPMLDLDMEPAPDSIPTMPTIAEPPVTTESTPAIESTPLPEPTPAAQSVPEPTPVAAPTPVSTPVPAALSTPTPAAVPAPPSPRHAAEPIAAKAKKSKPSFTDLIPVMEEEFQHAITHGKARIFEKWVGLQTRNRILNAVPLESELDEVLAGVFTNGERVAIN